jgi:hypothetical protein
VILRLVLEWIIENGPLCDNIDEQLNLVQTVRGRIQTQPDLDGNLLELEQILLQLKGDPIIVRTVTLRSEADGGKKSRPKWELGEPLQLPPSGVGRPGMDILSVVDGSVMPLLCTSR